VGSFTPVQSALRPSLSQILFATSQVAQIPSGSSHNICNVIFPGCGEGHAKSKKTRDEELSLEARDMIFEDEDENEDEDDFVGRISCLHRIDFF
jgi:hypothetical protein